MRTKHEPQDEPNANQRGVRCFSREGRPNPYCVQWSERAFDEVKKAMRRKVKTLAFPTAASRDGKATELRATRRAGMLTESISRGEAAEYRAFRLAIGDTSWQDVVSGWKEHALSTGRKPCTLTVKERVAIAQAEALADRDAGRMRRSTHTQKKHKLALFGAAFGHLRLDQVRGETIEQWINGLPQVKSGGTYDNYLKIVRKFFSDCVPKLLRDNPCEGLKMRGGGSEDVGKLSVQETAKLFHVALTHRDTRGEAIFLPAIGKLALEAFAGLRYTTASLVVADEVKAEDKGLDIPAAKIKTVKRQYIDGFPKALWAWVAIAPSEGWAISARQYLKLKSGLFGLAGVPHPRNCLRHGFATYHAAAFKNPGLLAALLCHRNQEQLWNHYKGRAKEAEGKLFWTITPQTVEALAAPAKG